MFEHARLKLTAWYLLIIMFVSISFSAVIYQGLSHEIDRFSDMQRIRIERRLNGMGFMFPGEGFSDFEIIPVQDTELVNELKHRILLILFAINGGIFVISGGLGYMLAGETLKPIGEMVEEQNRFITDSSHELRTPLTALKSAIEVGLRDKNMTLEEARSLISENLVDINKLQSLSDELLRLSHTQSNNKYKKFESVSIKSIIEESIRQLQPAAKIKNIKINSDLKDINIIANKNGLSELFNILLDNAIKYSLDNKKIMVVSKSHDGAAVVTVTDQGVGIDKKDLPHIFDRFYRADEARSKTGAGGYGLGLSIAKKIVDIHHGSIHANSQLDKGTTFTINIPIKQEKIPYLPHFS